MPSAQWGLFEWGDAEWGVADAGGLAPSSAALTLTGGIPTATISGQSRPLVGALALGGVAGRLAFSVMPPAGSLVFTGYGQPTGLTPGSASTILLTGLVPTLEQSGENMLAFQWAVLHPADILLGFQWVVLPQVVTGATLELTWTVIAEAPPLGFTWEVMPEEIFELFESAGVGAAAGIGEDILLPVGRVSRA